MIVTLLESITCEFMAKCASVVYMYVTYPDLSYPEHLVMTYYHHWRVLYSVFLCIETCNLYLEPSFETCFSPQDAFAKGEIFLGYQEKDFAVLDGLPSGMKVQGFCFTLRTPERNFHFSAEINDDKMKWMEILRGVIAQPLSPQDSSSMFQTNIK